MKVFNFTYSIQNISIEFYEDYSESEDFCRMETLSDNLNLSSAHQINIPELYNEALNRRFFNCKLFRCNSNLFIGFVETEDGDIDIVYMTISDGGYDDEKKYIMLSFTILFENL